MAKMHLSHVQGLALCGWSHPTTHMTSDISTLGLGKEVELLEQVSKLGIHCANNLHTSKGS